MKLIFETTKYYKLYSWTLFIIIFSKDNTKITFIFETTV